MLYSPLVMTISAEDSMHMVSDSVGVHAPLQGHFGRIFDGNPVGKRSTLRA
jgi:hypothetical protein